MRITSEILMNLIVNKTIPSFFLKSDSSDNAKKGVLAKK